MGRSPLSFLPMIIRLKSAGIVTNTFSYSVALENFASISARLAGKIEHIAKNGDYVLVGHSLGGVLLRTAVNKLPPGTPMPQHIFLLGSPVQSPRVAQLLRDVSIYRMMTGDCGQILASPARMAIVPGAHTQTTSSIGVKGLYDPLTPFADDINDGIVTAAETSAYWIHHEIRVPVVHTLLPSSKHVSNGILASLGYN